MSWWIANVVIDECISTGWEESYPYMKGLASVMNLIMFILLLILKYSIDTLPCSGWRAMVGVCFPKSSFSQWLSDTNWFKNFCNERWVSKSKLSQVADVGFTVLHQNEPLLVLSCYECLFRERFVSYKFELSVSLERFVLSWCTSDSVEI